MINQDTACMFSCCYDSKEGHLPAHSAQTAIFPPVRVETDFAYFFPRKGGEKFSSTLVLADMACFTGTGEVSNFFLSKHQTTHAAPVLVYLHVSIL